MCVNYITASTWDASNWNASYWHAEIGPRPTGTRLVGMTPLQWVHCFLHCKCNCIMQCISLASRQAWQPIYYPFNTQQWSSTTELYSRANSKEAVRLSGHIWLNIINSLLWWSWWMGMASVPSIPPPPIVCMQADFLHVLNFLYIFTVHQAKSTG